MRARDRTGPRPGRLLRRPRPPSLYLALGELADRRAVPAGRVRRRATPVWSGSRWPPTRSASPPPRRRGCCRTPCTPSTTPAPRLGIALVRVVIGHRHRPVADVLVRRLRPGRHGDPAPDRGDERRGHPPPRRRRHRHRFARRRPGASSSAAPGAVRGGSGRCRSAAGRFPVVVHRRHLAAAAAGRVVALVIGDPTAARRRRPRLRRRRRSSTSAHHRRASGMRIRDELSGVDRATDRDPTVRRRGASTIAP